ncbi:MAG: YraN family protein [Actinomycetota bacterium]|nr:YraN family protein [Actinomycetota bacterium]
MVDERKIFGGSGEKLAAAHLKKNGYEIVALNWRCRLGEIDLIAKTGGVLVVCEVKSRRGSRFGSPLEAITAGKQARLRRLGEYYWSFNTDRSLTVRFDAISILQSGEKIEIDHIENAF